MPQAKAPTPPCVQVWLSGQTIVRPGQGQSEFGRDHVHDALVRIVDVEQPDARRARLRRAFAG